MIQTAPENTIITRTPIPTPEKLLDPRMNTSWFNLAIVSMAIIKQAYVLLLLVVWRGRGDATLPSDYSSRKQTLLTKK